jgi:hypothetical protein
MAVLVAVGKAAYKYGIESSTGDDAKLAEL